MKSIILAACLILLLPLSVFAQTLSSVTVVPLTQSQQFLNRILFQILLAAPPISIEVVAYTPAAGDTHPASAACHSKRAALAAAVGQNPSAYVLIFAQHIVTTGNVTTAGALTGQGATTDSPATDAALFSAVNAVWSDTSGCVSFQ